MATGIKTGGRQAGTPNRMTLEMRSVLKDLIGQELHDLPERMKDLTSKERIDLVVKLLPYILPRVEATAYNVGEPAPAWDAWIDTVQ